MMLKLKITLISFLSLGLIGCSSVQSKVTIYHDAPDKIQGQTIAIIPAKNIKANSLEWRENSKKLSQKLSSLGYKVSNDAKKSNYTVTFGYGVDDGQVVTTTSAMPIYGVTGYSGANTFGHVNTFGNMASYNSTTHFTPTYGVTGYVPVTNSQMIFAKFVDITIKKGKKSIWEMNLVSASTCNSPSVIMDVLLDSAFKDFPGQSGTTQTVSMPWDGQC